MFKILQDCRASVCHSLEGLDYYVVEGGQAFSDLKDVIRDLDLTIQEKQQITSKLLAAKQYLKSEYKVKCIKCLKHSIQTINPFTPKCLEENFIYNIICSQFTILINISDAHHFAISSGLSLLFLCIK